ncbi:3-oxoacyl-ACP reductase family protein [Mycobacterium sp.]|uniref:3-oxoacyl-ACP reductase family protein n=1 Tax=Mycobacterium sp. TaxID=1785 RepID=UPI003C70BDF7
MTTLDPEQQDTIWPGPGGTLCGRVAFVTGGTRGIGATICRSLGTQQATVAAGYAHNSAQAKEFADDFEQQLGVRPSLHQGNVGSAADCRRTLAEVIDQHGRLDILVNNVGIGSDGKAATMTDEDWHTVLAVNLSGAFFMSQAALAHMVARGSGRIVNVASLVGETGNMGQANYAASKFGLLGLTKTLAQQAAYQLAKAGNNTDDGIGLTVNTISLGLIDTDIAAVIPDKVVDKLKKQILVARLGRPEEIAWVVHFLAADASAYITGQIWGVNGGMDM